MTARRIAPYGSWLSPIKAELLARAGVSLGSLSVSGRDVYWIEGRPLEGGREVIVRRTPDGAIADAIPPDWNARTTVHEYGGGAYVVHGETLFFSHFADQRLYRQDPGRPPRPITPEPPLRWGLRYADGCVTPDGRWLICVRERHQMGQEAINELVTLPTDGSAEPRAIASGHDFYASPRLSPDGRRLAWLSWDHPNMPWDGCDLWVGELTPDGALSDVQHVAGGPSESIFQPTWGPSGALYFVSDRTGWWNLYRLTDKPEALAPLDAEFGQPQWRFGLSTYAVLPDGRVACLFAQRGTDHLAVLDAHGLRRLEIPYTALSSLCFDGERIWLIAASPQESPAIIAVDPDSAAVEVVRSSLRVPVDASYFSTPRAIEFPTANGLTAHAFYYPPHNPDFVAPAGEKPPLLVISHGGPTSATKAALSLGIQFWTSRGFGLVDVNYGGSTGYGRAYRQRLEGRWGIVDVEDCIAAARYLAERGEVDPKRIAVRGGSAGGYTTLCALAFHRFFSAGASYFGVADLEALALETHKFESRYLDRLVGPYPAQKELYRQRSPLHYAHQIACPVILFQGLEDKVVPPAQAEQMVQALRANGLPYAYLAFEGEQHGFRKAETIQRAAEAELYFYSQVFRFELPEPVPPVQIENWPK